MSTLATDAPTRPFSDLRRTDVSYAGGKGANLGELTAAGLPVPPGFVVGAPAYAAFCEQSGVRARLQEILEGVDIEDGAALEDAAAAARQAVLDAPMPPALADAIAASYRELAAGGESEPARPGGESEPAHPGGEPEPAHPGGEPEPAHPGGESEPARPTEPAVAVRSSATAEDTASASFAGMNETFLNTRGADAVVEAVKRCWGSLFGARTIYYRGQRGFSQADMDIAVVVQIQIPSTRAGVMFTVDPSAASTSSS